MKNKFYMKLFDFFYVVLALIPFPDLMIFQVLLFGLHLRRFLNNLVI